MRAVLLDVPQSLLEERRRLGHDRWDEMWEGVLHMVPPPSGEHQWVGSELLVAFAAAFRASGLRSTYETGLFDPSSGDQNYRIPDLVVSKAEHWSERGLEGRAELVVEIRSPNDEAVEKLPFYARLSVNEVLFVQPKSRQFELRRLQEADYVNVDPDEEGWAHSALGVSFATAEGPALLVRWSGGLERI